MSLDFAELLGHPVYSTLANHQITTLLTQQSTRFIQIFRIKRKMWNKLGVSLKSHILCSPNKSILHKWRRRHIKHFQCIVCICYFLIHGFGIHKRTELRLSNCGKPKNTNKNWCEYPIGVINNNWEMTLLGNRGRLQKR